ncbi:vibrioferrin biosynthesis PvsD domain protein, partial [Vibrio parahaemolyticus V-223/04]
RRPNSTR